MKSKYFIHVVTGILFFLTGCSTQKNTSLSRAYHNLTARYNVYFNGYESFKQGVQKAETSFQENYFDILPIFKYSDKSVASSVGPEMERAIKKATKAINLHSIKTKPKRPSNSLNKREKEFYDQSEFNRWIDDSYLLIGKAQFYQQDYQLAIKTSKFILGEFPEKPVRFEALLWQAKALIETGDYRSAQEIFDLLSSEREFPETLNKELLLTYADYYLRQAKYGQAKTKLQEAMELEKKRKKKARYYYILAQINQKEGNQAEAVEKFEKVIKLKPSYEMLFNAKISRAVSMQASNENRKQVEKDLRKMLRDEKNMEYTDQIYFALANIYFKEEDVPKAIEYYKKSAATSIMNDNQKAVSYLSIADIYFDVPDYSMAQAYYDSSLTFLSIDYPRYEEISVKAKSLDGLVMSLNTIKLQDSLQYLASLDKATRLTIIDHIIVQEKERQKQEAMSSEEDRFNRGLAYQEQRRFSQNYSESGKWYFYNPTAKSYGQTEFKQRWGTRRLEDNWRRKNKQTVSMNDEFALGEKTNEQEGNKNTDSERNTLTREYYLEQIPLNDSLMTISNSEIEESLYKAAQIYQDELNERELAMETYKDLLKRFPDSQYASLCYYNLYRLNAESGNKVMENYYRNQIFEKFPRSEFALMLSNPDYYKEIEKKDSEIENFYVGIYEKYQNDRFEEVINECNSALEQYKGHKLIPQFEYLKITANGGRENSRTLREDLTRFIEKYPDHQLVSNAQSLIAYLDEENPEMKQEVEIIEAEKIFSHDPAQKHLIILFNTGGDALNINQLKFNVINYNLDFYPDEEFVFNDYKWGGKQVVTIEDFASFQNARAYVDLLQVKKDVWVVEDQTNIEPVVISESNFAILKDNEDLARYLLFYYEIIPENKK